MGAVLREQNALPLFLYFIENPPAKSDVINVGAGRAAKGENPSFCAKKSQPNTGWFFWCKRKAARKLELSRVRAKEQ